MAVEEAHDRRGRRTRGSSGLLEREATLRAIDEVLDSARGGVASALVIMGHPGMGKTRLYEASLDGARGRGLKVLRAAGAELEQNLAFGVAAQIARASLADIGDSDRRALLDEAPSLVRALVGSGLLESDHGTRPDLAVSHALFALLGETLDTPGLLAIDDLQWCDAASLEFVLYLLQRLDELPVSLVMTGRPGAHAQLGEILDLIAAHPRVRVEPLTPLGSRAVAELVQQALGSRANAKLVQT